MTRAEETLMTEPNAEEMPLAAKFNADPTQTKIPHPDGPKTTGNVPLLQRLKKRLVKQSEETGE